VNELALFAGAGGGILGGKLLGWRTVCAVEYDAYAASVLVARQNDGCLEPFPVWDDVRTFDGRPWRGIADVVSGGFPCTDHSSGKHTHDGGNDYDGESMELWRHMARIIGEVGPRFVFVENSPRLIRGGLASVLADFAAMGFDGRWGVVSAQNAGAPHQRKRFWGLFWPHLSNASKPRLEGRMQEALGQSALIAGRGCGHTPWRASSPAIQRVANGMANRVERYTAIGNGQVPAVAALAWRLLGGPTA
jgi:DNA (cytosine-5)-methyltransferase 1